MSLWALPGKSTILLLLLLPFSFNVLQAQQDQIRQVFPVNPYSPSIQQYTFTDRTPVEGALHIVAVMVEFQPDDNRFTSGNGTFEEGAIPWLETPGTNVDALPHDRSFFENRLEFVKNYFEKVSDGRLSIDYTVLPEIIRLDQSMEYYSPIGQDPTFEPLAILARDSWDKASEMNLFENLAIDPETTAFVIFHAGIGRDIELTGTVLENTPQDIPSTYLSLEALQDLFNDPSFNGFPAGENNFNIQNTIINPRTHTRRGTDISGETFLLPLSSNGMLTAQIGSHLGLPDLFDTNTGKSGIGRFGLMDGAGIFGFNGLFPPEPSAWEKIYLGWADTFTITKDRDEPVNLPAASLRNDGSIARIDLSSDEYFLVENRHRDPDQEGLLLTIRHGDGTSSTQTFTNQDTDFDPSNRNFDQLLEPGVITGVNNYDWALPGGYDEAEERNLNGGILIWHIDESVIRRSINRNRINANPDHRGIELKEADGAQDIGRPTEVGLSDNNPNGWPFDFWWNGNNASVTTQSGTISLYENRFAPDTTPSNESHSGALSFFELDDFSDNLPMASFSIRPYYQNELEITEIKDLRLDGSFTVPLNNPIMERFPTGIQQYSEDENDFLLLPKKYGLTAVNISSGHTSIFDFPDAGYRQTLASDLLVLAENHEEGDLSAWTWDAQTEEFSEVWRRQFEGFPGLISSSDGQSVELDHSTLRFSVSDGSEITELSIPRQQTVELQGYKAEISRQEIRFTTPDETKILNSPVSIVEGGHPAYLSLFEHSENRIDLLLITENDIFLYNKNRTPSWNRLVENRSFDWPAIADFNRDGFLELMYTDTQTGHLEAVNLNGAVPDFFPISPPVGIFFTGSPMVADLNGNGDLEILVTGTGNGSMNIYAFDQRGNELDPFPLLAGSLDESDGKVINPLLLGTSLAAVSPSGDLKVWKLPLLSDIRWPGLYGANPWNKVTGSVEHSINPEFNFNLLNENETYNWPNPAKDETNLRFQINQPAEVNIKITTVSGRLIYNRTVEASGGAPEEIRIDTSTWSSGGYYAVVTARSGSLEERKIVRIGVVR